jgi:pectin methylesterase-like acyl-CoA thioesterase
MRHVLVRRLGVSGRVAVLAAVAASVLMAAAPAAAATLTVCPTGPPVCEFATVQAALAAAHDGDRILIAPGTYAGGFTVGKSVSLIGAGEGQTTVAAATR